MKTLKFTPCILVYISIYILEVKLQNLLNDVYMYSGNENIKNTFLIKRYCFSYVRIYLYLFIYNDVH